MLTESSKGALWGKLGASAKTVAMGTAGIALWGSLVYYFAVGTEPDAEAMTKTSERLFLRMELPETSLLDGCTENFTGAACGGKAWIIISENRERAAAETMPRDLREKLPEPLWTEVVARHTMSDADCKQTLVEELPEWLSTGSRKAEGLHATLLPDRFTTCRGIASDIDPMRDVQAFWIMDSDKVVAEVRCTLPGGDRDADCQLSAYPEDGAYVVSYSRLPAKNLGEIVAQSPDMLGVLARNLPEGMDQHVNLAFLNGSIKLDDATATAVSSLHDMVR